MKSVINHPSHPSLRAIAKQSRSIFNWKSELDCFTTFAKTAFFCLMLINSVCHAQITLRFQPEINNKATRLGDVLIIENDKQHWSNLSLDSHPIAGEIITQDKIIDWMTQRTGHFNSTWLGKTQIQVKQSSRSTGTMLVEKAKEALIDQLGSTHYLRVEVTSLSSLKDSEYALDEFKTEIDLSFPAAKRVCVWLTYGKKSKIAVWFKIKAYAKVLVSNRDIRYNTALARNEFSLKERDIAGLSSPPMQNIAQQMWLKSSIERDTILQELHLKKTPLVIHGQHIKIATHHQHISIVMDAIALADGYLGETIAVKNPLNQKTFVARISGFQTAEITS